MWGSIKVVERQKTMQSNLVRCLFLVVAIVGCSTSSQPDIRKPGHKVLCLSQGDTLFVSDSVRRYWVPSNASLLSGPANPWVFQLANNEIVRVTGNCVVRRNIINSLHGRER